MLVHSTYHKILSVRRVQTRQGGHGQVSSVHVRISQQHRQGRAHGLRAHRSTQVVATVHVLKARDDGQ